MAAILVSFGFTFLIDRMTEVLTPDIYIELTRADSETVPPKWRILAFVRKANCEKDVAQPDRV